MTAQTNNIIKKMIKEYKELAELNSPRIDIITRHIDEIHDPAFENSPEGKQLDEITKDSMQRFETILADLRALTQRMVGNNTARLTQNTFNLNAIIVVSAILIVAFLLFVIHSILSSIGSFKSSIELVHTNKDFTVVLPEGKDVENAILDSATVMDSNVASITARANEATKLATDAKGVVELVGRINEISSSNARSVEEIAGAAEHLYKLTENLNGKLNQFKS